MRSDNRSAFSQVLRFPLSAREFLASVHSVVTCASLVAAGLLLANPAQAGTSALAGGYRHEGKVTPATQTMARKSGKAAGTSQTTGDDSDDSTAQARKGKAGSDKSGADTDTKGAGSKSGSLDSLMDDVVTENKTNKGKAQNNKEMDAVLKDVQKTGPAPAPKKEEPAAAPPLSPAEISAAMSQLKTRGNACAQRAGRGGTAELKITVSKEGKVTDVHVGGKIAGTPAASCVEQAAKSLTFRRNAGLRFDYRMDVR